MKTLWDYGADGFLLLCVAGIVALGVVGLVKYVIWRAGK